MLRLGDRRQGSRPRAPRIRRASCLVGYWRNDAFVLENYLARTQTTVSLPVLHVLTTLKDGISLRVCQRAFAALPKGHTILRRLLRQGLLVVEGSECERRDAHLEQSWEWGPSCRFFHFVTQRVPYEPDLAVQRRSLARYAGRVPPPSAYKEFPRRRLTRLDACDGAAGEFWDVLRRRRTRRRFSRRPLTRKQLGTLLFWTWGRTHEIHSPVGSYILKTSPSGGARHPIEVYPLIRNVEGVPAGLYHYSVKRHALEYLHAPLSRDRLVRLMAGQPWFRNAPVVFFMTAIVERSMWKYKHDHAYRVLLLDAGHLGQTFHLVCTHLGLAPFTSSAKLDTEIEQELGIDGIGEMSLYVAAAGIPEQGPAASE